jgi:hypothetical protein
LQQRLSAASGIRVESRLKLLGTPAVGFRKRAEVIASLMTGLENSPINLNEKLWQSSRRAHRDTAIPAAERDMATERLEATAAARLSKRFSPHNIMTQPLLAPSARERSNMMEGGRMRSGYDRTDTSNEPAD